METSISRPAVEGPLRFYLGVLLFLAPGLAVWAFAVRYLYPKVQVVWRDGGAIGSEAQWLMDAVGFLVVYGWLAVASLAVALAVSALGPTAWESRRRVVAGLVVGLLNTAILLGLAALCILALLAAPGLRNA